MREREKLILGKPPRVAPLTEITNDMRVMLAPPGGFGKGEKSGEAAEMFAILLHNPELVRALVPMLSYHLAHGALSIRDRELAILRIAWINQAPFEWGEHVRIAKREGITEDEILATIVGSAASIWSDHDRAVVRAVEELHEDAMISDKTWKVLERTLTSKQLVEFPLLVGQYQSIAYLQNSLRMRLREGNSGLSER